VSLVSRFFLSVEDLRSDERRIPHTNRKTSEMRSGPHSSIGQRYSKETRAKGSDRGANEQAIIIHHILQDHARYPKRDPYI